MTRPSARRAHDLGRKRRDDIHRSQAGAQPRADLGADDEHARLCGELRRLGDVLRHRDQDQGGAQSQRNRVRPAGGHPHPDRLAHSPAARHPDRPLRRADRVLPADARGGDPHLGAVLRHRVLAVPGAGVVHRRRRRLVRRRHRLHVGLVQQGAAGHGDGHLRRRQRGLVAHQVHRPADHRGLRHGVVADGAQGLRRRHAGDGDTVLVPDVRGPAAPQGRGRPASASRWASS